MRKRKPRAERPAAFFAFILEWRLGGKGGTQRRCRSDALDGARAVRSCGFVASITVFRLLDYLFMLPRHSRIVRSKLQLLFPRWAAASISLGKFASSKSCV